MKKNLKSRFERRLYNILIFKLYTPTECGASVYHTSVCLSLTCFLLAVKSHGIRFWVSDSLDTNLIFTTPLNKTLKLRFERWPYNILNCQAPNSYGVCGFRKSHVCLFVSDPFLIGCEKSRDKILGFWLSWHQFNRKTIKMWVVHLVPNLRT